jgi:hypothetical protein
MNVIASNLPIRSIRLRSDDSTYGISNNELTVPMASPVFTTIPSGATYANIWLASINLDVVDEDNTFLIYLRDVVSPAYLNIRPVGIENAVLVGKYHQGIITPIVNTVTIASLQTNQFRVARADPSEGFSSGSHQDWDIMLSFQIISPLASHQRVI